MARPDTRLHATHDPELVAAYAAGDATGPELAAAEALVAGCTECASLHRDLRAIMAALPAVAVPARPRDFRLTPEVAATLRPSRLRRLLAPFGSARFAFAGPAGAGLAALGLAGILLSGGLGPVLPGAGGTGSTAISGPEAQRMSGQPAPAAAPSAAPSAAPGALGPTAPSQDHAAPSPSGDAAYFNGATGSFGDKQAGAASSSVPTAPTPPPASAIAPAAASTSPVMVLGITLVVAGLLMLGIRLVARRLA